MSKVGQGMSGASIATVLNAFSPKTLDNFGRLLYSLHMKSKPQAPSLQGSGIANGNEPLPFTCDACGKRIETGPYASFGGNIVPYIAPKQYHISCIPSLKPPCTLWTATERKHLMYCGKVVADMRYANARGRVPFILAALNAAEEKL